ncbi:MAG TPA: shikimate kinase [Candidatus Limnocylindria bacterium]|nr:shikimate kinase [Candidatus Limnocylindria bacterium]
MSDQAACRILLIGMMGSGKSTIGRRLAAATGWPYVDNDDLVVRATGMSSRALVEARGEGPMRDAERAATTRALDEDPPLIVGIAAGAIVEESLRRALRAGGFVVWLRAGSAALSARATRAGHRPFLQRGGAAWIAATNEERAVLYASIADLIIDTDTLRPRAAVDRILAAIARLDSCPPVRAAAPR